MTSYNESSLKKNPIFAILLTGEIESAELITTNNIYCKYSYEYGQDWTQLSGIEEGISSTAQCSSHNTKKIILNTPLEATFTSTNPFKWPQIVFSCYGPDNFGNDVIRGYGATFLPSTPGKTIRKVPLFVPQASTTLQKIIGYFTGRYAEFIEPRIVAMAEGREVTRVSTKGFLTINMTIIIKDMKKYGYNVIPKDLTRISEYPMPNFDDFETQIKNDTILEEKSENELSENLNLSPNRKIKPIEEESNDEKN